MNEIQCLCGLQVRDNRVFNFSFALDVYIILSVTTAIVRTNVRLRKKYFRSPGLYPLTCSALVALSEAEAPADRALRVIKTLCHHTIPKEWTLNNLHGCMLPKELKSL